MDRFLLDPNSINGDAHYQNPDFKVILEFKPQCNDPACGSHGHHDGVEDNGAHKLCSTCEEACPEAVGNWRFTESILEERASVGVMDYEFGAKHLFPECFGQEGDF